MFYNTMLIKNIINSIHMFSETSLGFYRDGLVIFLPSSVFLLFNIFENSFPKVLKNVIPLQLLGYTSPFSFLLWEWIHEKPLKWFKFIWKV